MRLRPDVQSIWFERHDASRRRLGARVCFPPHATLAAEARAGGLELMDRGDFARIPSVRSFLDNVIQGDDDVLEALAANPETMERVRRGILPDMHHTTLWKRFGRRVYALDPVTCELLANTALPGMPFGEVPIPIPAFYLVLPRGWLRFRRSEKSPDQRVEGVSVMIEDSPRSGGERRVTVLFCGDDDYRRGPEYDHEVESFVAAPPGARLDDVLDTRRPVGRRGGDRELGERLERTLFGLLLYLQSEHPLLESVSPPALRDVSVIRNPAKRRRAEEENARTTRLSYFYVGGERPAYAEGLDGASRTGHQLDHQVWVTGHWKQQPYGPQGSLRRPQWIKPYLKGPDLAESAQLRVGIVRQAESRGPTSRSE